MKLIDVLKFKIPGSREGTHFANLKAKLDFQSKLGKGLTLTYVVNSIRLKEVR